MVEADIAMDMPSLLCPGCNESATPDTETQHYPWLISYSCSHCDIEKWSMCKECTNQTIFKSRKAINRHNTSCHSLPLKEAKRPKLTHGAGDDDFPVNDFDDDESISHPEIPIAVREIDFTLFDRKASQEFYKHNQNALGAKYIVSRSIHQTTTIVDDLTTNDCELHLCLAKMCTDLSRVQRNNLGKVLQVAVRAIVDPYEQRLTDFIEGSTSIDDLHAHSNHPMRTAVHHGVPQTVEELRSKYAEGKHSIQDNLPHPEVNTVGADAYVSLKEVIRDLLARGTAIETAPVSSVPPTHETVRRVIESKHYLSILDRARKCHPLEDDVLVLWINEWSDDFEPNNTKQNKGSVWLKTCTISPPHALKNCANNTYPIALGPKGSHDEIEDLFVGELLSLSDPGHRDKNWFYDSLQNKMRLVYAELFVSLQDQPERRGANHLLAGNSTMHSSFGRVFDLKSIKKTVPSCDDCLDNLLAEAPMNIFACSACVNWSFNIDSELLDFNPPKDYPKEKVPPSGCLRPFPLNYKSIIEAVECAREQIVEQAWTEAIAHAYLGLNGLNDPIIEFLLEPAVLRAQLADAKLNLPKDDPLRLILEEVEREHPGWLENTTVPPLWRRNVELWQHVDVIMHLLFLGITKTTGRVIAKWTKSKGKHTAFLIYAKDVLESIPLVPWLAVAPYTGDKLGGWVSENYLALARLSKWFYGGLDLIAVEKPYVEPTIEHSKWIKKMNVDWLTAHELSFASLVADDIGSLALKLDCQRYIADNKKALSNATASIAKLMVGAYKEHPHKIPPLGSRSCGVRDIQHLVQSMHAMIALIMETETNENSSSRLERHIKIFLTIFARVDASMNTAKFDGSEPQWVSSYNFLSLLNLPNMIEKLGPLRNIWEGGFQGEGYIQQVKPLINMGLRKKWATSTMKRLLKNGSLEYIIDSSFPTKQPKKPVGYHRYDDLGSVLVAFESRTPLSAAILEDGTFAVIVRGDNRGGTTDKYIRVLRVEFEKQVNGCSYHSWKMEEVQGHILPDLPVGALMANGVLEDRKSVLLLPLLGRNGLPAMDDAPLYTVINSEWQEINEAGDLVRPSISFSRHRQGPNVPN